MIKMQWKTLEDIQSDISSCTYDILDFYRIYNNKQYPREYDIYIKEGFKSLFRAYFEICNAYLLLKSQQRYNGRKHKNYIDYLDNLVSRGLLPEWSVDFLDSSKKLRNAKAHGYLIPEFDLIYGFVEDNKETLKMLTEYIIKNTRDEI
ncbi:hypothetical protein UT300012_22510 [Paraclostridium bifermentans]